MTTQETIKIIKNEHCGRCDGKFICNGCYIGKSIKALEKQAGIERALERLEEESRLAEKDKEYARAHNPLQYERCDSYLTAIDNAIEILKEEVG